MADALLKNLVRWQTDRVEEPFGFDVIVDARCGERGIASEIAAQVAFPVTLDDGFQKVTPTVSAMDVAGAQGTSLQIAELVEQEKRMVAGAAKVAVVGRALLFAMGRADA